MRTSIKLRSYQSSQVEFLTRGDRGSKRNTLVVSPTGSGKLTVMMAAAGRLVATRRRVLILLTQESIERESLRNSHYEGSFGAVTAFPVLARESGGSGSESILGFCSQGQGILCGSHASFTRIDIDELTAKGNLDVFVDEGHHAGEDVTELGKRISKLRDEGARISIITATPFRSDSGKLVDDSFAVSIRTLGQHMVDPDGPFCPQRVNYSLVPFDSGRDLVSIAEFRGDDLISTSKSGVKGLARQLVSQWETDGRPKVVVRLPSVPKSAGVSIEAIAAEFEKAGARVFNAFGLEVKSQFNLMLMDERQSTYATSGIDVLIGCGRVSEGMDWPHCCGVYCVGVPASQAFVQQLCGRAMRLRDGTCPVKWRKESLFRFFAPLAKGKSLRDLPKKQAWHAMLMCAAMDMESNVSAAITAASKLFRPTIDVPTRSVNSYTGPEQFERAAVALAVKAHLSQAIASGIPIDAKLLENIKVDLVQIGRDKDVVDQIAPVMWKSFAAASAGASVQDGAAILPEQIDGLISVAKSLFGRNYAKECIKLTGGDIRKVATAVIDILAKQPEASDGAGRKNAHRKRVLRRA